MVTADRLREITEKSGSVASQLVEIEKACIQRAKEGYSYCEYPVNGWPARAKEIQKILQDESLRVWLFTYHLEIRW